MATQEESSRIQPTLRSTTPMATHEGIIEGKDIMLFVEDGGRMKPTAAATSHKISHKASTKSRKRVTKDSEISIYDEKSVESLSCTISVNALKDATTQNIGHAQMLKAFKAGKPIKAKYGYKDETGEYEEGNFIITSIDEDTPAEGDATWSATLESTGKITTKGGAA